MKKLLEPGLEGRAGGSSATEGSSIAERFEQQSVTEFAQSMKDQLETNRAKGRWSILTPAQILENLRKQVVDLENAVIDLENKPKDDVAELQKRLELVGRKCANVGNWAMFMGDNTGGTQAFIEG